MADEFDAVQFAKDYLSLKVTLANGGEIVKLCRALIAQSENAAITELQVQAGAVILATTPLIDAPKLSHDAWMGLSRLILETANAARRTK